MCAVQLCRDRVQHFPKVSFALSVEYAERKSRLSASATLFLGLGSRHFYERENAEKLKKKQQKYVAIFFLYSGMFVAKTFFSSQNNFWGKRAKAYLFLSKVQDKLRTFFPEQSTFKIEAKKRVQNPCDKIRQNVIKLCLNNKLIKSRSPRTEKNKLYNELIRNCSSLDRVQTVSSVTF